MENFNNCMKSNRALDMESLECKETNGKINPFFYINSKDIRAYLRSLNYEFSSPETAWLIWQSMNTSLDDRHRAWTKLIETMPDCHVEKRMDTIPRDSLHGFLKKLIEIENRFVNLFYRNGDEAVYSFSFHESGEHFFEECDTLYSDWAKCFDAIDKQAEFADRIIVRKRWLNEMRKEIKVEMDGQRHIFKVESKAVTEEESEYLYEGLFGFWFEFPVPFQKGDIVIDCSRTETDYKNDMCAPFVFNDNGLTDKMRKQLRKNGSTLDMIAYGLFQDSVSGELYSECMHNYMNLEYYCGELKGKQRVLKAAANYLKDEIGIDLYSQAYRRILEEEAIKHRHIRYTKEGQELAGLIDDAHKEGGENE